MQEWNISTKRPGYMEKTVETGNCTVHLYKPILDDVERAKREAHFKSVAERTLRRYISKETGYGNNNSN